MYSVDLSLFESRSSEMGHSHLWGWFLLGNKLLKKLLKNVIQSTKKTAEVDFYSKVHVNSF